MTKIVIKMEVGNRMIAEVISKAVGFQLREMKKQNPMIQEVKVEIEE